MLIPTVARCQVLPLEPWHNAGQGVTGAFEGWFKNSDGTSTMLLGYFNRNLKQELDIPIGPSNRIEPGGPDQGQPTHFLPGRGWGVFTITVPRDFGAGKLTWTLAANGETAEIPISLNPLWEVNPFSEVGIGNTPPVVRFAPGGPSAQGPGTLSQSLSATVSEPVSLTVWVSDDAKVAAGAMPPKTPPVTVSWSKYRGPGIVTFTPEKPPVERIDSVTPGPIFSGKTAVTALFSLPGEYELLVVANDWSGEGGRGFQCCWTTAKVKVSVRPK
ncbi:MAG: hypothetical protein JO323_14295 [Acidobacteriia bacterium]|nr:hypothetical protein [Terriglobia bacterium]